MEKILWKKAPPFPLMPFLDAHLSLFILDKNDAESGSLLCYLVIYSTPQPSLNTLTIFQMQPDQPSKDWERSTKPPGAENREPANKGHGATFTTTN